MRITFRLNGQNVELEARPGQTLLSALRDNGVLGVKHGCETGECGACTVLLDGVPRNSCVMLAAQASGYAITTIEGLGGLQMRGWRGSEPLHALQTAFIETGAIQCGYCTPAMIIAASALLSRESSPTESQIREALTGCSAFAFVPVQAILRAAAVCGEVPPIPQTTASRSAWSLHPPCDRRAAVLAAMEALCSKRSHANVIMTSTEPHTMSASQVKVDALKLRRPSALPTTSRCGDAGG
jgi:putative selenate reductase molybdopterin-binding subunit